ncbi:MAG: 4-hydroxy-tetrahydrodipicolinate reductase [Furfurilactobacillus sp.]|jgi:4-hydroxy-tetrahydrodipicolinate reductase|uniref:4-hydroxy-tetrahydrodipicolinate reductase n=1 Tax=Furfurilactobacillus milii TaxID=2888272 RepID=A0ABT6DAU0_9LACO|nr:MULTISPECIES: 4-hydroxy-tetrahydrodipicolinate reductase [Furfurilactobacillus]QLE67571.1 Dihydrodipicolinate reductase [Furfurilactobacillus rossiae]MCF6161373.1 4-hydroxy-tetrahydrodipicolinate reductase [Furfurilactobacillus milii]MCF6163753.1 4-hydroxy-tetrahydrodipicolinate reductase [Furfurilactobacillus milii]MCH4011700.1 4-hydroxy-tetrahydrodipicolinate reductase [Furfurilactobacillus sp.]MCH4037592.1 4-hydroxy-tetrahydrodipicolinate reductase [Furfurilactobacillus sp.]
MSESKIRVIVAGFRGSMGTASCQTILNDDRFELTGVFDPHAALTDGNDTHLPSQVVVATTEDELPEADVWLDFTTPTVVENNVEVALQHGLVPLVGTSGLTTAQIKSLQALAASAHLGGLIVPNFGLSAVLLTQFAKQAAKYFPNAEIIEMHHADKRDAPSGTAVATAHAIAAGRQQQPDSDHTESSVDGVRGGIVDNVPIHAVRLPGYLAHEQVLFGGTGEALTIRQDTYDRESFMVGVKLALSKVTTLTELKVGLEQVLD